MPPEDAALVRCALGIVGERCNCDECVEDPTRTSCFDCGVDVQDEYYMVRRDLWDKWAKSYDEQQAEICVGCLEHRVGRRLTPFDFTNCSVNVLNWLEPGWASRRLVNRMKGGPATPADDREAGVLAHA